MRICTRGVVVKRANYGNTSQIVHLHTPDRGLVAVLGKGVWRKRNPLFEGGFDLGALYEFVYLPSRRGRLGIVTEAQEVNGFRALRNSRARMADGFVVLGFVGNFSVPGAEDRRLHILLEKTLFNLDQGCTTALLSFLRLGLEVTGFFPQLKYCWRCKLPLWEAARYHFSWKAGGVVCPSHTRAEGYTISREALVACSSGKQVSSGAYREGVRFLIDWSNWVLGLCRSVLKYPFYLQQKFMIHENH